MQVDWTLNASDLVGWLIIAGGGILAFFKVFLTTRDTMRDVVRVLDSLSHEVHTFKNDTRDYRQTERAYVDQQFQDLRRSKVDRELWQTHVTRHDEEIRRNRHDIKGIRQRHIAEDEAG